MAHVGTQRRRKKIRQRNFFQAQETLTLIQNTERFIIYLSKIKKNEDYEYIYTLDSTGLDKEQLIFH